MNEEKFIIGVVLALLNILFYIKAGEQNKLRILNVFAAGWAVSWGIFSS